MMEGKMDEKVLVEACLSSYEQLKFALEVWI